MIAQAAPPPAVVAPVPANAFAPPLGRTLRLVTEQERDLGGTRLRFTAERRLLFRAEPGGGFLAELTLEHIDQQPGGRAGDMFRASQAALLGRTLRFHLDAAGRVLRIDDQAAVWSAQVAAMDAAVNADSNPLHGFAPTQQLTALSSLLMLAVAPAPPLGTRTVSLPVAAPGGVPVQLEGRQTADEAPRGLIRVEVTAQGPLPSPKFDLPAGTIGLERTRLLDPRTGLLRESREVTTIGVPGPNGTLVQAVTTTRTTLMVS